MGKQTIPRDTLKRCIACGHWVTPEKRLKNAFHGGTNMQFYVCLDCARRYKYGPRCVSCGCQITAMNACLGLYVNGRARLNNGHCAKCREQTRGRIYAKRSEVGK